MNVLIVAKTRMQNGVCVGGLMPNGEFVRLLDIIGNHLNNITKYEIRQVWDLDLKPPINPRLLPHSEDMRVISKKYITTLDDSITMLECLKRKNVCIYEGSITRLFESKLRFTSGGIAYISKEDVPQNSVCFWIADRDLIKKAYKNKVKYIYDDGSHLSNCTIAYVGLIDAIDVIPKGTLIRMSLCHWWKPEDSDDEKQCYLQISGWYDLASPEVSG